jgi:hypothetical protein
MNEDFDAPMELIYTHELKALKHELEQVTAQRDAALAMIERMKQPIEYSAGGTTTPPVQMRVQTYI